MIFFLSLSNENLKHAHVAITQILTKNELNPLIEPFIRTHCLHQVTDLLKELCKSGNGANAPTKSLLN